MHSPRPTRWPISVPRTTLRSDAHWSEALLPSAETPWPRGNARAPRAECDGLKRDEDAAEKETDASDAPGLHEMRHEHSSCTTRWARLRAKLFSCPWIPSCGPQSDRHSVEAGTSP